MTNHTYKECIPKPDRPADKFSQLPNPGHVLGRQIKTELVDSFGLVFSPVSEIELGSKPVIKSLDQTEASLKEDD